MGSDLPSVPPFPLFPYPSRSPSWGVGVGVWVLKTLKLAFRAPSAVFRVNNLVFLPRRSADWLDRLSKVIVESDCRSFISIPRMFVSFVWLRFEALWGRMPVVPRSGLRIVWSYSRKACMASWARVPGSEENFMFRIGWNGLGNYGVIFFSLNWGRFF